MVCVYCSSPTQVVNSRRQRRSNHIWRRRKCISCGGIFTTNEKIELETSLVLQKGQKHLDPFSRDRLMISIYESCRHRPDAATDAAALTQTIINKVLPLAPNGAVQQEQLVNKIIEVLRNFDNAAATIYAAYHKKTQ